MTATIHHSAPAPANSSFSLQAFRFPSTPTVNFVATVQFCQDRCDPVDCSGELTSYGRRKRSIADNSTSLSSAGPRVLPEQLMLGLRLTVGEDQVAPPHPPSRLGRGNFPEREEAALSQENYYPAIATLGQQFSKLSLFHISIGKHFRYRRPQLYLQSPVDHHSRGNRGPPPQLRPRHRLRLLLPDEEEALGEEQGGGGRPGAQAGGHPAPSAASQQQAGGRPVQPGRRPGGPLQVGLRQHQVQGCQVGQS